ncbi:hypothetical protein ACFDR8_003537 [Arthrobacter sp. MP_2.3]
MGFGDILSTMGTEATIIREATAEDLGLLRAAGCPHFLESAIADAMERVPPAARTPMVSRRAWATKPALEEAMAKQRVIRSAYTSPVAGAGAARETHRHPAPACDNSWGTAAGAG